MMPPLTCPDCHADLRGQPIPPERHALYGKTHFSRALGRYDLRRDMVVEWSCPDCGARWDATKPANG